VTQSYLRYLLTAFEISNEALRQAFQEELFQDASYTKGPYLEATPPFRQGRTLRQLVLENQLSPAWLDVPSIPVDRPLYWHQDRALEKIRQGRNVIVSTGTGSGKTEAFLYPILDDLMREHTEGHLTPGVRALLLYPMNALVNDQLKRLRDVLADLPYITFGRFTGETAETDALALPAYPKGPPTNERISRASLRATPPHILVTNYAMLEYLLQRPDDTPFFDGPYRNHWKFLVLDEIHTYSGASGAEVGMLIRRLKDRLGQRHLQAIGTSATMGGGEQDYPQVVQFAEELFSEKFDWDPSDSLRQDVVGANRVSLNEMPPPWGRLAPSAYGAFQTWHTEEHLPDVDELCGLGVPKEASLALISEWRRGSAQKGIYDLLAGDANIRELFQVLETSRSLQELIDLFSDSGDFAPEDFLAMVNVAVWAKPTAEDQSLIPARYHLFVRATEGVFIALYPQWKIFLQRHETYEVGDETYPVFELGYCRRCGASYLVGNIDLEENKLVPYEPYRLQNDLAVQQFPDYFGMGGADGDRDVEDDTEGTLPKAFEIFQFCRRCGWIAPSKVVPPKHCGSEAIHDLITLTKSPVSPKGYHRCVQCGAGSGRGPSRFITGQDAAAAVVATAVYSALQPDRPVTRLDPTDIRKLLVFSDSRQDAAFFAPYLETSYERIVWRRLIWKALTDPDMVGQDPPWVGDVHQRLMNLANQYGMMALRSDLSVGQKEALVWEVLLRELVSESDIGLEGVGMVTIAPIIDPSWSPPPLAHWTDSERIWDVLSVLWNEFRAHGALSLPHQVQASNILPYEATLMPGFSRSTRANGMLPWLPTQRGYRNSRLDYIARLGIAQGWPESDALAWAQDLANDAFTYFTDESRPWARANTEVVQGGRNGIRFQANYLRWTIQPVPMHDAFRCISCGRITVYNLYNVCQA